MLNMIGRRKLASALFFGAFFVFAIYDIFDSIQTEQEMERYLSKNLGVGLCQWTAPEPLNISDIGNTTTLLASYPGSGKRLGWRILEALTGVVTGDDWDLSQEGQHVLTMKSSYPHPEGKWSWGNLMDQEMLLIRNPRYALPSYHTIRYELNFSQNWAQSYERINFTYTERPAVEMWEEWRDLRFDREMDRWCWYIDYWMSNGRFRRLDDNGNPMHDPHCQFEMSKDCFPQAVIQFEKLISGDAKVGMRELDKMGDVLDASPHVAIIAKEARPCVYQEVIVRKEFYNANRDGNGPGNNEKTFTILQLRSMRNQIRTLYLKWHPDNIPDGGHAQDIATDLSVILLEYIDEITTELQSLGWMDDD